MPSSKRFHPYHYLSKNRKVKNSLIIVFICISVLMKISIGLFSLKGWISAPQFSEEMVTKAWFTSAVEGSSNVSYFYIYFILDYFWPFLLFFLSGYYVYKKATLHSRKPKWFYWVFLAVGIIAFVFDCIENTLYLIYKTYPETIAPIKTGAFAVAILIFVLVAMYYSLMRRLTLIRDFILSAWISLLFLAIIGVTLPKAPQVNSIIVDLYYHPVWFVVILLGIYAPMYCIVLSHYPAYFLFSSSNSRIGKKNWRINDAVGLFGIIWHSSDSKREKVNQTQNFIHESSLGFLRRTLGVVFYMALFYMIAYTTDTNFDVPIRISGATFYILLLFIWWLYQLKKKKDAWYAHHKSDIHFIDHENSDVLVSGRKKPSLHNQILTYVILLVVTIVVHAVLFILLLIFDWEQQCPYTFITVVFSLICILMQTLTYMYYRTFRAVFKYAFFNKKVPAIINSFIILRDESYEGTVEEKRRIIIKKFEKFDRENGISLFRHIGKIRIRNLSLGALSNNVIFLKIIAYFGFVNFLFLIVINIFPQLALKINAILILLSYFFLFYGMIVIILKHYIYYKFKADQILEKETRLNRKREKLKAEQTHIETNILEKTDKTTLLENLEVKFEVLKMRIAKIFSEKLIHLRNQKRFLFILYCAVLLLIVLNFLARFNEKSRSNLFELAPITETLPTTADYLETYTENLPNKRYYIGCYGGGMKANAWTMTVLNALDKNNDLYDKTVCLSGASGGTIGLINYSVIKHNTDNNEDKMEAIRNIGTENILSMDLTHVFGRDLINHAFVPFIDSKGKDRSTSAMEKYARYAKFDFKNGAFDSVSYRKYWYEMYTNQHKKFPILISNTTDIKGRQGMAVSIKTLKNTKQHDILYAGAIDILDINDKTLSFYNAVSTTNRFPLISPAATIRGKGQYNDGGIYENSGLLSAFKLYEAISAIENTAVEREDVFINIVNDKSAYIRWRMNGIMKNCKGKKIHTSNEISAILNSVAATEMVPNYIKDKLILLNRLDNNICFKSIYLPHRFYFDDVKALYGDDIKNLDCVDTIYKIIKTNNDEIRELVKKRQPCKTNAIIEPEMSRVMAIPAFEFMEQMLEHSSIRQTIIDLQE